METFDFFTTRNIRFGRGRFDEIGPLAARYGRRICLVTGGRSLEVSGRLAQLMDQFASRGLECLRVVVTGEPVAEEIDAAVESARQVGVDVVVAIGGGSVLDAGKAIAALLTNGGEVFDYLEGVGRGRAVEHPSAPMIAVPTTAGTGSEATKNAVIGDRAHTFKKSMRSEHMLPLVALIDPALTDDCPAPVTAACGMDALAQLLESFTSLRANPLTDALAIQGLTQVRRLPDLMLAPHDVEARDSLALASLLGGICLANAGLGAVHGLASPLGALFPVPHGVVCAATLPGVVRANGHRAQAEGGDALLRRYAEADTLLFGGPVGADPAIAAEALADHLAQLTARMAIPGLAAHGIDSTDFVRIIAGARGSSMKTNPVTLGDDELAGILEGAL